MNKTLALFSIFFLSVLAKAQTFEWAKAIGGDGISNVTMKDMVATDNQGVFIVGSFYGTIDFDPSDGVNSKVALSTDGFAAHYDFNGNLLWVYTTNALGNEEVSVATFCNTLGQNILNVVIKTGGNTFTMKALNSSDGSVFASSPEYSNQGVTLEINGINKTFSNEETAFYLVGSFAGVLHLGNMQITNLGYSDAFCIKFTVTNSDWFSLSWAKRFGMQSNNEANDVAINGQNTNPVIVGGFSGTIDFGSGSIHTSAGYKDVFVATLSSNDGALIDANAAFTLGAATDDVANSIYRGPESFSPLLIGGKFSSTVDFDPSGAVSNIVSSGSYDGFVANYTAFSNNSYSLHWANNVGGNYQEEVVDVVYNETAYYTARIQNSIFGTSISLGALDNAGNHLGYGGSLVPETLNAQAYVAGLEMNSSNDLYCAGIFGVNTDFDPGAGTATLFPVGTAFDGFIQKMSSTLNTIDFRNLDFNLYPNPAAAWITISNENQTEISAVTITDANGRVLKNDTFDSRPKVQVNVEDLSTGIYWVKITSNAGSVVKKIIKN